MIEQNYKVFSNEAKDYGKMDYWRFDEEFLVNKFFKNPKEKKILVLGCGGGRVLPPLHKKGFKKIVAIDIVRKMVEESKKKVAGLGIEVLEMDACKLKFKDNSFDYAFFPFHGIDYIYPDIYVAVKEVARVLKPSGVFIFNSHNRFFLKQLKTFFDGPYSNYKGLLTYRTTYFDYFKLKKYFKKVKIKQRISMQPWLKSNWKDVCYKLLPVLNKSTYFIAIKPKKINENRKK